jgi:hypothetical protein
MRCWSGRNDEASAKASIDEKAAIALDHMLAVVIGLAD